MRSSVVARITSLFCALCVCTQASLADETAAEGWQFSLTPYLWLPTIGGDLNYELPPRDGGGDGSRFSFDVGPTDWLELLNFAALASGTARNGRFSVSSDIVYLRLAKDSDGKVRSVDGIITGPDGDLEIPASAGSYRDVETELDGLVWSLELGYTLWEEDRSFVDVIAGVRYFGIEVTTDWAVDVSVTTPEGEQSFSREGRLSQKKDLWDGVVGFRGEKAIGQSRWSVPFHINVGTGSSDVSWDAMAGLSYGYDWGKLMLLYRHLQYDQGSDGLLEDFSFSGPAIGARFEF
jgi:hypothetical protein